MMIKEGFLMKEYNSNFLFGGNSKKWVKRYFQLSNEYFFEFKENPTNVRTVHDTGYKNIFRNITRSIIPEEAKQSWCLNSIGVVAKNVPPFTLKIVFHSGEKIILMGNDTEETDQWFQEIKFRIEIIQKKQYTSSRENSTRIPRENICSRSILSPLSAIPDKCREEKSNDLQNINDLQKICKEKSNEEFSDFESSVKDLAIVDTDTYLEDAMRIQDDKLQKNKQHSRELSFMLLDKRIELAKIRKEVADISHLVGTEDILLKKKQIINKKILVVEKKHDKMLKKLLKRQDYEKHQHDVFCVVNDKHLVVNAKKIQYIENQKKNILDLYSEIEEKEKYLAVGEEILNQTRRQFEVQVAALKKYDISLKEYSMHH